MDVSAYLSRIRYDGPLEPSLQTLDLLHRAHLRTVPFEDLDLVLKRPVDLSEQALFEKQIYPDRISGGAPERPYDVAGWTLPMQMGVEALPVASIREPEPERRLTRVSNGDQVRHDLGLNIALDPEGERRAYSPIRNPLRRPFRLAQIGAEGCEGFDRERAATDRGCACVGVRSGD